MGLEPLCQAVVVEIPTTELTKLLTRIWAIYLKAVKTYKRRNTKDKEMFFFYTHDNELTSP